MSSLFLLFENDSLVWHEFGDTLANTCTSMQVEYFSIVLGRNQPPVQYSQISSHKKYIIYKSML